MSNSQILPAASAALSDARGLTTPQFYRFFQSLAQNQTELVTTSQLSGVTSALTSLGSQVGALQQQCSCPPSLMVTSPLTANGTLQNGVMQLGMTLADSVVVLSNALQLDGDADTPGNTFLYSTGPAGAKGWNPLFEMFEAGAGITLTNAPTGIVTISGAGAGTFQSTAVGNIAGQTVVAATTGGVMNPALATSTEVPAIVGVSTTAATSGNPITVMTEGQITEALWSWTPGLPIYCGLTGGALTQTAPTSGAVVVVGVALSATTINVQIGMMYLLN